MADQYRVIAGYVTVETEVGDGRAHVDVQRGAQLPGDVPQEQVDRLLALGQVEPVVPESAKADEPKSKPAPRKAAARKS
jgi:hypothetical protein